MCDRTCARDPSRSIEGLSIVRVIRSFASFLFLFPFSFFFFLDEDMIDAVRSVGRSFIMIEDMTEALAFLFSLLASYLSYEYI